jgi:predicted glutamine amidotransferase
MCRFVLYMEKALRYEGSEYRCRSLRTEKGHGAVLVASESFSSDAGWEEVPVNQFAIVRDGSVQIQQL